ncbi:MAG: PASTA domain-containing protein [Ruminococcaceae bacterium]|nr:PASTA domain-containing protein [Oscillospiraceae bacterium]
MAGFNMRMDRATHKKAYFLLAVFFAFALFIIISLFKMQVIDHEYYQNLVLEQMTTEIEVNPERGDIHDTNGNVIATNATRYMVVISPQDILDITDPNAKGEEEVEEDGFIEKIVDFLISLRSKGEEKENEQPVFEWQNFDGVLEKDLTMDRLIAGFLSGLIEDVEYDEVMEKTKKVGRRYEVVARLVDEDTADAIREFIDKYELKLQLYLVATSIRYYPYDSLASHVIGFTDVDGRGAYGMEQYYNNLMEGSKGRYITAQDAHHQDMPFEYETYVEEKDGYNLVSTLDMYIQYELENQLENALKDHKAACRVTGIVMDVNTGGILGMGTYPSFDLNDPRTISAENFDALHSALDANALAKLSKLTPGTEEYETQEKQLMLFTAWKNKAITETYEPGSTFKIMTTAMALEEKVVRVDEGFYCGGSMTIEGYPKPIHCHKRTGHGQVSFAVGLQQSCNPVLMTLGLRLGQTKFYNYFEQFGYTSLTGIDLPNEASAMYHSFKDFTNASLAVYSFGQTFKTTPLQQITAISSVANGGYLVTPHVLKEIVDDDGNVIETYETDVKRHIVSEETCNTIAQILEEGVSGDGGARNAYVKGYKVAAKTGTSEKRDKLDANGEKSLRVGSCVAFAPADDPQVAVLIVVDEPSNGSVYGSVVAAPYVSNLLSFILPYMGYEPVYTAEEMKTAEISVPNYVGSARDNAIADLEWREISYKIMGDGPTVVSQIPEGGSSISKQDGIVYLYTGSEAPKADITVPDLVGKTAEAANRILTNLGLNVSIVGATNGATATVSTQYPAAGEVVPRGTLVTVEMRHAISSDG